MAITFNNTVFPSGHVGPTLAPSGNSVTQAGVSPGQFTVNGTVNAPGDPVSVTNAFNVTSTFVATQLDDPGRILLNQQGTLNHFLFSNTPLPQGLNTVTFSNATLGDFQVVCFATGTRILTEAGEVPIEALREGMLAAVADAAGRVVGHKPIRWIGRQTVRCAGGWRPGQAAIRIRAGALGPGVPKRDLVVSMAHGIALGGCWVRAAALVNGASIVTEPPPAGGVMTYWHVELEDHAILLAEGAPAESYLDDGNRAAFDNGLPHLRAPWASGDPAAGASYAARACLPLTAPGLPGFAEVQAALLDRAPLA
ncbi:MAG: Hint domain-containing protein, partial [Acetobacteraceae bacterium]|nr:Hint domain-containing protein [Acetobacteraceae bacterium]